LGRPFTLAPTMVVNMGYRQFLAPNLIFMQTSLVT
jgi:hypothetical protein